MQPFEFLLAIVTLGVTWGACEGIDAATRTLGKKVAERGREIAELEAAQAALRSANFHDSVDPASRIADILARTSVASVFPGRRLALLGGDGRWLLALQPEPNGR